MELHISETLGSLCVLLMALYGMYRVGCWRERRAGEPLAEDLEATRRGE